MIIPSSELEQKVPEIIQKIKEGAIFICPTDTIYGLSCDATNEQAVQKIRSIKQRDTKPLSIWVPSKNWITTHCQTISTYIHKLPGPYTLITTLNNPSSLAPSVLQGVTQVGVRIPQHPFHKIVEQLNTPLITTSVNIQGQPYAKNIHQLPSFILSHVDFIIEDGEKSNKPSTIINTITGEITER